MSNPKTLGIGTSDSATAHEEVNSVDKTNANAFENKNIEALLEEIKQKAQYNSVMEQKLERLKEEFPEVEVEQ